LTQAYGNVSIYVPPQTASDEEIARNPAMLKSYQNAVVSIFHTGSSMGFLLGPWLWLRLQSGSA